MFLALTPDKKLYLKVTPGANTPAHLSGQRNNVL